MNAPRELAGWPRFQAALLRTLLSGVWGMDVEGLEHVPKAGRVIVAVNHRSWMDPPLAALAVSKVGRYARFLAKQELFRNPLAGFLFRIGGAIPLDRSRGDLTAMRSGMSILGEDGCMVLFPEGTRSRTGVPGRAKPGVGFFAHQSHAPVVPARVWNTEKFPALVEMRIKFGSAMRYEDEGESRMYQQFADRVMEAIFAL